MAGGAGAGGPLRHRAPARLLTTPGGRGGKEGSVLVRKIKAQQERGGRQGGHQSESGPVAGD